MRLLEFFKEIYYVKVQKNSYEFDGLNKFQRCHLVDIYNAPGLAPTSGGRQLGLQRTLFI
jgi:hypothetical protein